MQSRLSLSALLERRGGALAASGSALTRGVLGLVGLACVATSITACGSHSHSQHTAASASSVSASSTASASSSPTAGPHAGGTGISGAITQTVPAVTRTTATAVPLSAQASFGNSVTAKLTSVTSSTITARAPGEVSGPGLTITVAITNGTSQPIDLSSVNVTVTDSAGLPGIVMSAGASPARGTLAAGKTASGVYVFTVAAANRHPVSIFVSYTADAPIVLFQGTAP